MSSSLSIIADNLAEGPQRSKCKDCKSDLEYLILKLNTAIFECADCNKMYKKSLIKVYPRDFETLTSSIMETSVNFD